jgi:hypothetical protein
VAGSRCRKPPTSRGVDLIFRVSARRR